MTIVCGEKCKGIEEDFIYFNSFDWFLVESEYGETSWIRKCRDNCNYCIELIKLKNTLGSIERIKDGS